MKAEHIAQAAKVQRPVMLPKKIGSDSICTKSPHHNPLK